MERSRIPYATTLLSGIVKLHLRLISHGPQKNYDDQGNYEAALEYYGKALEIYEKVLGKEHPDTAMTYNNLANVYDDQGNYEAALEYYGKALEIREKVLGKEHPDTAGTYYNMGSLFYYMKDFQKAEEYFRKALPIYEKVLGKNHPDTKDTKEALEIVGRALNQ